jgi:hypothetical protein
LRQCGAILLAGVHHGIHRQADAQRVFFQLFRVQLDAPARAVPP